MLSAHSRNDKLLVIRLAAIETSSAMLTYVGCAGAEAEPEYSVRTQPMGE